MMPAYECQKCGHEGTGRTWAEVEALAGQHVKSCQGKAMP